MKGTRKDTTDVKAEIPDVRQVHDGLWNSRVKLSVLSNLFEMLGDINNNPEKIKDFSCLAYGVHVTCNEVIDAILEAEDLLGDLKEATV